MAYAISLLPYLPYLPYLTLIQGMQKVIEVSRLVIHRTRAPSGEGSDLSMPGRPGRAGVNLLFSAIPNTRG